MQRVLALFSDNHHQMVEGSVCIGLRASCRVCARFRQPNAALLTTKGPQVCASTGPRRDPRDPQWFAAARASGLQLTTDLPHQVSYGQHVTPHISWPRLASTQRDRLASLGRRNRFRIKKGAVCHRELRLDHLPDQLVFIVQELHHFQRGWGGVIPRRFCDAHPLAAQEQQAPNLASITAVSNRVTSGLSHGIAIAPQFQTID